MCCGDTAGRPRSRCRACLEHRNWTRVRKVVGWRRMDTTGELLILRELYANVTLHKNFFQPTRMGKMLRANP